MSGETKDPKRDAGKRPIPAATRVTTPDQAVRASKGTPAAGQRRRAVPAEAKQGVATKVVARKGTAATGAAGKGAATRVATRKAGAGGRDATKAAATKAAATPAAATPAAATPAAVATDAPATRAPKARAGRAGPAAAMPSAAGPVNAGKPTAPAAQRAAAVADQADVGAAAPWTPPTWSFDQQALMRLQSEYVERVGEFFNRYAQGAAPVLADRRFGKAWLEQPQFGWQAAWYLLNAEFTKKSAELINSDRKTQDRIRFLTQQWVDALSPANFLASNPEAQAKMVETGGESLRAGITNLIGDIQQGRISQTDLSAFEVGRNVGTSPGTVVYENALVQLIQYEPTTATVGARPLLMVPPSINKFYILDLQPENSFIGHAVAQGNTVYVVSWRNVKEALGHLTWDDYLQLGVVDTIEVVRRISGQQTINALGFCVGGTILCTALAALAARGERPVESLTLLTTLLDFADPGTLGVFVDEMHVALREKTIGSGGILPGRELSTTFSTLRPNDLVWNYVVNNYLKGESPVPFDLLYWNADSTNLPGPMFCWYLRHTYLQNELREPGRLTCLGQPIDLRTIDVPTYVLCAQEDHIVPWQAGFASAHTLVGPRRFVVGASGHIAGVVNPPAKKKRSYRTGPAIDGLTPDAWMAASAEHPGSWWPDWADWLGRHRGADVAAPRAPGNIEYRPIEPAPGRYVKEAA